MKVKIDFELAAVAAALILDQNDFGYFLSTSHSNISYQVWS